MAWDDGFSFSGYQGGYDYTPPMDPGNYTLGSGGNDMAAFSSIAAGIGAAGSLIGGVSQAFGGGQTVQGYQLPTQLEYQFIDTILSDIDQYDQNIEDLNYAINNFDKRLDIFDAALDDFLPPEGAMEAMSTLAYDLAAKFGDRASELVDSGFLTEEELRSKEMIDEEIAGLQSLRDRDFEDPRLEQQLREQKAQLQQDLVRSGASPSQIALAMQRFNQGANESRFTRSEELANNRFAQGLNIISAVQQRNQMLQSGRLQNFQMAQDSMQRLKEGIMLGSDALSAKVNVGQLIQQNQLQGLEIAQAFRQERLGTYELAGKFDFKTKGAINEFMRGRAEGKYSAGLSDPGVQDRLKEAEKIRRQESFRQYGMMSFNKNFDPYTGRRKY